MMRRATTPPYDRTTVLSVQPHAHQARHCRALPVSRYSVSDISADSAGDPGRRPSAERPPRNDWLARGRRPQPTPATGSIGP